jgi:hypothetical protein
MGFKILVTPNRLRINDLHKTVMAMVSGSLCLTFRAAFGKLSSVVRAIPLPWCKALIVITLALGGEVARLGRA